MNDTTTECAGVYADDRFPALRLVDVGERWFDVLALDANGKWELSDRVEAESAAAWFDELDSGAAAAGRAALTEE